MRKPDKYASRVSAPGILTGGGPQVFTLKMTLAIAIQESIVTDYSETDLQIPLPESKKVCLLVGNCFQEKRGSLLTASRGHSTLNTHPRLRARNFCSGWGRAEAPGTKEQPWV